MRDEGKPRTPSGGLPTEDEPPEGFRIVPSSPIPHPSSLNQSMVVATALIPMTAAVVTSLVQC